MLSRAALLATVLALSVLTAPAAWAQSAGDEQYQDPFAGQNGGSSSGGGGSTSAPQPSAPASTPAPAPKAPAATAAAVQQPQLPRTGAETLLTALAGVGLVMSGVGLRLRLPVDGG